MMVGAKQMRKGRGTEWAGAQSKFSYLDVLVNWLENLDLGEKFELNSGLEAE
eukprot:SAG31_NODE_20030_length_585_cov_1.584362_1_plen_52_part_00